MTIGPETCYRVRGGVPLRGTVFVQGAKNAALKMIAASLLASEGRTVLRNVPPIEDVRRAIELAQAVGAVVKFHEAERTLVVDASQLTRPVLPAEIARRFRGSVLFAPPARCAVIAGAGGAASAGQPRLLPRFVRWRHLTVPATRSTSRRRGAAPCLDTPSSPVRNLIFGPFPGHQLSMLPQPVARSSRSWARWGRTLCLALGSSGPPGERLTATEHTGWPDRRRRVCDGAPPCRRELSRSGPTWNASSGPVEAERWAWVAASGLVIRCGVGALRRST